MFDFWAENKLDAILSPGFGLPAMKHGFSADLSSAAMYTFIWNLISIPTGALPITLVSKEE